MRGFALWRAQQGHRTAMSALEGISVHGTLHPNRSSRQPSPRSRNALLRPILGRHSSERSPGTLPAEASAMDTALRRVRPRSSLCRLRENSRRLEGSTSIHHRSGSSHRHCDAREPSSERARPEPCWSRPAKSHFRKLNGHVHRIQRDRMRLPHHPEERREVPEQSRFKIHFARSLRHARFPILGRSSTQYELSGSRALSFHFKVCRPRTGARTGANVGSTPNCDSFRRPPQRLIAKQGRSRQIRPDPSKILQFKANPRPKTASGEISATPLPPHRAEPRNDFDTDQVALVRRPLGCAA
jgi:hypothetical protein